MSKEVDWSMEFYRYLGYRITDSPEDKAILNLTMNEILSVQKAELKKKLLEKDCAKKELIPDLIVFHKEDFDEIMK